METKQILAAINQQVQQAEDKWKPLNDINADLAAKNLRGDTISQLGEESVVNALKIIYTMIGLRYQHFPDGEQKAFLHNYILKKYGNKTPKELILAFDLAIQGQLKIDDVKVYDQFTCEYIAKIMNGYRDWLLNVNKNLIKKPIMQITEKKELTDEEKAEWIEEWVGKEKIDMELIPLIFYDYLDEKKIIRRNSKRKV